MLNFPSSCLGGQLMDGDVLEVDGGSIAPGTKFSAAKTDEVMITYFGAFFIEVFL